MGTSARSSCSSGIGSWIVVLVWLGFCAWFIFDNGHEIRWFGLGDTDDNMRIMQVRGLLHGQGWFDLRQYRLNPPRREHPLVAAGRSADRRADPRLAAVPRRRRGGALGGRDRAAAALSAAAVLAGADGAAADRPARLSAGVPGPVLRRLDQRHVHAGADRPPRLAARAAGARALPAIADPKRVRGGLVLGISTALSLAIGLEMMIYLALAGAAMVLFWVDDRDERERLARLCGGARRRDGARAS